VLAPGRSLGIVTLTTPVASSLDIFLGLALLISGCVGSDTSDRQALPGDAKHSGDGWAPPRLDRVWRSLRSDPPFVSALMLVGGPPPRAFVDDYFDRFNATVVHFWENGLPRQLAYWEATGRPGLRFFAWVDTYGRSRDGGEILGGIGPEHPGRVGFQIGDEPGLEGNGLADVFPFREGVDAVRAADPGALVVMNFRTEVRDVDRILDYAGRHLGIDVFSFDRYNLGDHQYRSLELIRRFAQKYHRPYWRYLYGFRKDAKDSLTASDLRWDAMSGLVYGFSGFTWFIYQSETMGIAPAFFREPGYEGVESALWQEAGRINRVLVSYLRVTTHLWSTDVRYRALLPVLQPEGTRPWKRGAGGNPYLTDLAPASDAESQGMEVLAGFFRDDFGEHYVMLQNVRHVGASPPNDSDAPGTVRVQLDFDAAPSSLDEDHILLFDSATERAYPLAIERRGAREGIVKFRLDPGEVVLFKYATGRPFVGTRSSASQ